MSEPWKTKVPDALKLVRILDDGKLIVVEASVERLAQICDEWACDLDHIMDGWMNLLDKKTLEYLHSKNSNTTPVANTVPPPVTNVVVANTEPVNVVANTDPVTPVEPVVPPVAPNVSNTVDSNTVVEPVSNDLANTISNVIENVISTVIPPKE